MTFHLARALIWPALLPIVLLLHIENSVLLVICLSLYANFTGDLGAHEARKAGNA